MISTKKLLFIIGVVIFLFISAFIVFYGKYEIFKFPFSSDVWGRVSDWVIIAVTILTAYYLYHTLRAQQVITKIANSEYVYRIRPDFDLHVENYSAVQVNPGGSFRLTFTPVITSVKYDARDVRVTITKYFNKELISKNILQYQSWEQNYKHPIGHCQFLINKDGTDMYTYYFDLEYSDITRENHYKKRMKIHNKKHNRNADTAKYEVKANRKLKSEPDIEHYNYPSEDNSRKL